MDEDEPGGPPEGPAGEGPREGPAEDAGAKPAEGAKPKDGGKPREDAGKKAAGDRAGSRRDDQFSHATSDPLAGAFGGSAADSADQAYRTWVRTILSGGPATVFGGGSFRDITIGGTTVYTRDRRDQAPGPVRRAVLDELIDRYVPVAGYQEILDRLRSARLIVLRGAPGTGRTTTGLRLLAEAAGLRVSRFDPEAKLSALEPGDLEEGSGYLLEVAAGRGSVPTDVHMDRLGQLLFDRQCYLVLIAPHDLRHRAAFDGYTVDCPLPDTRELFSHAIDYETALRPDADGDVGTLAFEAIPDGPGAVRLPSEVWLLSQLLLSYASGEIAFEEVARRNAESLSRYVSEWFDPLAAVEPGADADERTRLAAFRIALAVLNGSPYDLVAEAGERLATEFGGGSARRPRGRVAFADRRHDYIANSRARLTPGSVVFGKSSVPSVLAAYEDDRLPTAVLRHIWDIHGLRAPLISWLQVLSQDKRPFVWMPAALTIGLLSSWDFAYAFHELIDPWATSPDPAPEQLRRRLVAAVALDAAALNDEIRPVISEILDGWRNQGTAEQRLTGAIALGYDLGLLDPAKSLRELRVVGCWQDGSLALTASWAVARIFARGGMEPVLATLLGWLYDHRIATRNLGQLAMLRIADLKVADVEYTDSGTRPAAGSAYPASRRAWPLLAAAADQDPGLLGRFADLLWQVTQSAAARGTIRDVLSRWIRAGQRDTACVGPVGRLIALLGDSESAIRWLLDIVDELRHDPDDPLPASIADRLAHMIETNTDIDLDRGADT